MTVIEKLQSFSPEERVKTYRSFVVGSLIAEMSNNVEQREDYAKKLESLEKVWGFSENKVSRLRAETRADLQTIAEFLPK